VRLIAIQTFHPQDLELARPIQSGEVLDVSDELAREWLALGLVRLAPAPDEDAMRRPEEKATAPPPEEKAILRPRENAARRKR
jgi:hypothetical protein